MTTLSFYQKISSQRQVTTRSAAQLAGLSVATASMALRRLALEGLVTRIKPGEWLVGSAAREPAALVAAVASPYEAYLSGWSALRFRASLCRMYTMRMPAAGTVPVRLPPQHLVLSG